MEDQNIEENTENQNSKQSKQIQNQNDKNIKKINDESKEQTIIIERKKKKLKSAKTQFDSADYFMQQQLEPKFTRMKKRIHSLTIRKKSIFLFDSADYFMSTQQQPNHCI